MLKLILGLATIVVVALFVFEALYEARKYPICPACNGNLNSMRKRFFDKEAICSKHGTFLPDEKKTEEAEEKDELPPCRMGILIPWINR